jgi:hypothetical protein
MATLCVFVTAIYNIGDPDRVEYHETLWSLVRTTAECLPNLHIVCAPSDVGRLAEFPHVKLYPMEFKDLSTYAALKDAPQLPATARPTKDTLEFLILQNAKVEYIRRVQDAGITGSYFAWIDAGLPKLLREPRTSLQNLHTRITATSTNGAPHIVYPGCWPACQDLEYLKDRIHWRFCGSVILVPASLVQSFAREHLRGCAEILEKSGTITWEVNVWAYIEPRLPFRWVSGDHNDRILDCFAAIWSPRE